MSDWLYAQAGQIVQPDPKLWSGLLNYQLQDPTRVFCTNIERLLMFWKLSPHMMEVAAANIRAQYEVILDAGTSYQMPETPEAFDKMLATEISARAKRKYRETGSLKEATGYDIKRGVNVFDEFLRRNTSLDGAVRALLESQITLAWTAFETLSEDVWQAVQACHPQSVTTRPNFRRLESIRATYRGLLPTSENINTILSDSEIRKLNLVRNIVVHKGGIVDQEFLDQAEKIAWHVSDPLYKLIHIDGARVKELVNPAIRAGEDLIRAVDKWLAAKKPAL
jgi:hypothetical protein